MGTVRVTNYCLCGESLTLVGRPNGVKAGLRLWWNGHQGPGHGPTDKATCRQVRLAAALTAVAEPPPLST